MSQGGREIGTWFFFNEQEYLQTLDAMRAMATDQPDERRAAAYIISRGRDVAVSIAVSHQLVHLLNRLLTTRGATGIDSFMLNSFRWHRIGWVPEHFVLGRGSWVRVDEVLFDEGHEPIDVTFVPEGPATFGLVVTTGEPRIDTMGGLEMSFLKRCLRHDSAE